MYSSGSSRLVFKIENSVFNCFFSFFQKFVNSVQHWTKVIEKRNSMFYLIFSRSKRLRGGSCCSSEGECVVVFQV